MKPKTPRWRTRFAQAAEGLLQIKSGQAAQQAKRLSKRNGASADTGTPFAIFAPYNPTVQLIGDFSDWQPVEMTKDDSGWWFTHVDLPDGEHRYKFRVQSLSPLALNQWVDVGDPRATRVDAMAGETSVVRIAD